jgi:uncharacterized membrane protein
MKFRTVRIIEGIVCIILPIILAITVIFKIWYLPLIFLFIAVVMFGVFISRLKEVYEDELTRAIEEKGGNAAISIGSILMILTGMILLAASGDNLSRMGIAAITLFAASYGLSLINFFTRLYYRRKLGGR